MTLPTLLLLVSRRYLFRWAAVVAVAATVGIPLDRAHAQFPDAPHGEVVPRDVRDLYDRGMKYLADAQADSGEWPSKQPGPGVTGLCLMVFLASGEDPNFGIYSQHIRRALRSIISGQDGKTGYLGGSMYHHGFGMLALAEAYGAVDDRNLWPPGRRKSARSIGEALELAVRAAVTAQKQNPLGAWRYSPEAKDADTSVSGAVLVGLLAARNAGIEVPDESIDQGIAYYVSMTSDDGQVAYSGRGGRNESLARSSIGALVYALAHRKDLPQYQAALGYSSTRQETASQAWAEYTRYYQAQALFQGDVGAWRNWNTLLIRQLKKSQREDGSFAGQLGPEVATSLNLLALALNYRFLPIYER